jgi:hypothetical protein
MKLKVLHALMFLAAAAGFGAISMLLWNALLPDIFGVVHINFWQALGLLVLSRVLFGRFGVRGFHGIHGMAHHNAVREKWMKMTPEERKEFIKKHHGYHRYGHHFGLRGEMYGESSNDTSGDGQEPAKAGGRQG